jgi:hypothetical protein
MVAENENLFIEIFFFKIISLYFLTYIFVSRYTYNFNTFSRLFFKLGISYMHLHHLDKIQASYAIAVLLSILIALKQTKESITSYEAVVFAISIE